MGEPKKKPNKSKSLGSGFEREISKYLTKYASGQTQKYWYWRSPSSGAVATITPENGDIAGDIIALNPEAAPLTGYYSIECKKSYPKTSFHGIMKGNKDEIIEFWKQCVGDAYRARKSPMLIYKKKGYNALVGIKPMSINLGIKSLTLDFANDMLPPVVFYDMDEFFSKVTFEMVCEWYRVKKGKNVMS
jgi:Holliday junction resolvase